MRGHGHGRFKRPLQAAAGGVLDKFPGAAVAFSMDRYLSNAFQGNDVILVRRSSDNAELGFTPTEITNGTLTGWVGVGNDGFVKTWYDQSGSGRDATQTTNGNQPQIVSAGALITESGFPVVSFDGVADELIAASTAAVDFGSHSVFVVTKTDIAGAFRTVIQKANSNSTTGREVWVGIDDSSPVAQFGAGAYGGTVVFGGDATALFIGSYIGNENVNQTIHVDGSQVGQNAIGANQTSTEDLTISSGGAYPWNGPVLELIVYPNDQTINRAAITGDINSNYSIF